MEDIAFFNMEDMAFFNMEDMAFFNMEDMAFFLGLKVIVLIIRICFPTAEMCKSLF